MHGALAAGVGETGHMSIFVLEFSGSEPEPYAVAAAQAASPAAAAT